MQLEAALRTREKRRMASSKKNDSIRLSTYDELFSASPKPNKGCLKKLRSLKRKSIQGSKGSELFAVLQRQRVVVDERAIHFVAEARSGKRADARNSVFKLAQRYQMLPDREHVQRIKQLYGRVKENEDSGDEEWDKASERLPGKLDQEAFLRIFQKDSGGEHLLNEMEEINQETQELTDDVVTKEELNEDTAIQELDMIIEDSEKRGMSEDEGDEGGESDVEVDDDDLKSEQRVCDAYSATWGGVYVEVPSWRHHVLAFLCRPGYFSTELHAARIRDEQFVRLVQRHSESLRDRREAHQS